MSSPSAACCGRRSSACSGIPSRSASPAAPTPAFTPGVRSSPSTPIRRVSTSRCCNARSTRCAGRRSRCATSPSSNPTSMPGSRPPRACTATACTTNPPRTPSSGRRAGMCRNRSIWPRCATPASRWSARTTSRRSASAPGPCGLRPRRCRSCGRCAGPSGRARADGMLVFEIEARSFGRQMVRSIVGTLVDIGLGRRRASEVPAHHRRPGPQRRRVGGAPARPHPLVGPILTEHGCHFLIAPVALFAVRPIGP